MGERIRMNRPHDTSHRWAPFLQHLRIFVYVMMLLVAIDLATGTDDLWVHLAGGIWGAILGMHFIETLFFGGGMFGVAGSHCFGEVRSTATKPDSDTQL